MNQEPGPPDIAACPNLARVRSELHVHSHGHLTNNVHLLNSAHIQRSRVLMEARNSSKLPLMNELTMLRRARSLRDPSTSPAWSISSSHGSRRALGNAKKSAALALDLVGSDTRRYCRRSNLRVKDSTGGTREKLDFRVGGHHWAGELFGEAADQLHLGTGQKENNVLKRNGLRNVFIKHHIVKEQEAKPKVTNKKGNRLENLRSSPWLVNVLVEEKLYKSETKSGRNFDQHSEPGNIQEASILNEEVRDPRAIEDGSLQRGFISGGNKEWLDEPVRSFKIARRMTPKTVNTAIPQDGIDNRSTYPALLPEAARRELSDLFSVMDLVELRHERESRGGKDESKDEISLRNGLNRLPALGHTRAQSPLLHRDYMTVSLTGRPTPRVLRTFNKGSGSRNVERRQREVVNVCVDGTAQRKSKGRRPSSLALGFVSGNDSLLCMDGELDVSELPRNGCGMPWYWTRVHKYRGRRILDLDAKSLTCGCAEGSKQKDEQCRSAFRWHSIPFDGSVSFSRSLRSSDTEHLSHSDTDDRESPIIPRADGDLLTGDRSGQLAFGFTREYLSGMLMPSSATYGNKSLGAAPVVCIHTVEDNCDVSLSEKYRPRSFNELLGQNLVAASLSFAMVKGKISSLYLFHGPRGTGKSSAARIFAQALNCLSESVDLTRPCGFCSECTYPSQDIREFSASKDSGSDSLHAILRGFVGTPSTCRWKTLIIDDCHWLTANAWNSVLKALEKSPQHLVFILTTTDAEKVHRYAFSRSQKFLFSKIKEADIANRLQYLAREEGLDVEESALSVVAARSRGSLRDAEATLEQLSLLGKTISLSMVQEMAGLVPDDKLIDLLDLAMSAEAVATVRCMRELLDRGVEPLTLVGQLATLITDILAGTYVVSPDKLMRGFFFRSSRKEEAVRLRQALKILSEAEKQLRLSSDQSTWLAAALLQFALDRSFQPSSVETSVATSPIKPFDETCDRETARDSIQPWTGEEQIRSNPDKSKGDSVSRRQLQYPSSHAARRKKNGTIYSYVEAKIHPVGSPLVTGVVSPDDRLIDRATNAKSDTPPVPGGIDDMNQREFTLVSRQKLDEVWQRVLLRSHSNVLRQLLQGQAKLLSLLLSDAFGVAHLEFRHPAHKARAERSRSRICNAFEMALGCPVELRITLACMPSELQLSVTGFEDQPPIFASRHKDKPNFNSLMQDRRLFESKGSLPKRESISRMQHGTESMDIPQSLYDAVMGDSKGFKPEILPVVSSAKWGRYGGHLERPRDNMPLMSQDIRHSGNERITDGPPLPPPRVSSSGKVRHKASVSREDTGDSVNQEVRTDMLCGPSGRKKNLKDGCLGHSYVNSGHTASIEQQNLGREAQIESYLLCWRVQRVDKDKVQRRRRQRKVRVLLKLVPCTKSSQEHC